ncbi:GNAT family N-acetyltransferase [Novosphingobium sp.]|uniref:GNAT family N-acetyltransferase n=1 Tax=Novosphingobium sp. TaxID=1874826 RepID=UPI0025FDDDBA|nr:GNAT family N-acetyltransferase [Novosphingobium sp.]
MLITPAILDDAAEIAAVYAHHVIHGTASYETRPPGIAEMSSRMAKVIDAGWPWLVARDASGLLLGYAYASQFRDRTAYRYACENSIYIRHDRRGEGTGKALLIALMQAAMHQGFRQMFAVIGGAEPGSVALHAACGFVHAGRMQAIGRKHGHWLDTVYMQAALGEGALTPPPEEPQ